MWQPLIRHRNISLPAWLVTAFTGLLCGMGTAHAANDAVVGSWQGKFRCGNADSAFVLTVEEGNDGLLEGEFRFSLPGGSGATGAYRIRGRYTPADRSFESVPGDWIDRPSGWRAAGIGGSIHENGLTMTGIVRGCGGSTGAFEFRADREGVAVLPDGTPAVMSDPIMPPTGGPFEGLWRGAIGCRDREIQVTLDMIQDDEGVVAMTTISLPGAGSVTPYTDSSQLTHGIVTGDNLQLTGQNRPNLRTLSLSHIVRGLDLRLLGNGRIDGSVEGLSVPSNWQCKTVLLRYDGPPQTPSGADRSDLVGTWAGFDFGVGLSEKKPLSVNHSRTTQAEVFIAEEGGRLYGSFSAASPVNQEPAQQDRLTANIRPLMVMEDGRIAFVSVAVRKAEGAFDPTRSSRYPGDAFLLLLEVTEGGELAVERFGSGHPVGMVLRRMTEEAIAGLRTGEGPPVHLPSTISGTVGEAVTLEGQCRAIRDWAAPVLAGHDLQRMQISTGMQLVLSLFDDPAFVPTFGIPFGLTADEERNAIFELARWLCPKRIGLQNVTAIEYALRRSFDEVVGMLVDRQESGVWHKEVLAEIDALTNDVLALDRLAGIETDAKSRGVEISAEGRATLDAAIAAKRNEIAVAALMARADDVMSWPTELATLDRLTSLIADAASVQLPSAAAADLAVRARAKADVIIGPTIEAAIAAGRALPATLAGLAEATRLQRDIDAAISRLGPELGFSDAREKARTLHEIRMGLINDLGIQEAFRSTVQEIEARGDAAAAVEAVALRFLEASHFRGSSAIPAYAEAVAEATASLEIRSIRFADHSTRAVDGEPTAKEMLLAVKDRFDQINEELSSSFGRCQRGEFQNDPIMAMECLAILGAGGGGQFKIRLTQFEKLGCTDALIRTGFICDYVLGFEADSPFMHGRMAELMGAGSASQGRFLPIEGGWLFSRLR
ncbi:MAG: hypothetical protein K8H74_03035 [Notoacmeibacter sp.]|nr:hypothetical protein [Notoacmeibacter sp.]